MLFVWSRIGAYRIARDNPPVGAFLEVNGTRMHYVHVPAKAGVADLPPLVFIHGASANLNDQMVPFRQLLEGRAELLFLDRPGHGWSERGPDNSNQSLQADTIVALMDALKIKDAIIVAHSYGGSVATPLTLKYPERVRGLLFLAAASHPWPNKKTQWYYDVAVMPVLGRIFTETVALPAGSLRIEAGSEHVFCPNKMPNNYLKEAQIPLVLRPSAFRNNAVDVAGLHDFVSMISPRYGEIDKPTIVITGDQDTVVLEEVHSGGLARDIKGSELVWIKGLGHKPDYIVTSLAVAAIEKLNGAAHDLQAAARNIEDAIPKMGSGTCE